MPILTKEQLEQLLANGRRQLPLRGTSEEIDFVPVVKLFMPGGSATWLLTELDPEDRDTAFGLCDLGQGCPELGSVSLSELATTRGHLGLSVEVDGYFDPDRPISAYADEAMRLGRIVT